MRRFQSQWLLWLVAAIVCVAFTVPALGQRRPAPAPKGTKIQGHIVRVQGTDRFVIRTADKREVILHVNPQTRFLLNERAARFEDLREGAEINAVFDVVEDRNLVSSVIITPGGAVEAVPAAEIVEGTVLRVIEPDNQIVIRTARGKEMILVAGPKTTFTLDDRTVRLTDFRPGMAVKVNFDVKGQRNMMRSVVNMPRRPK
jgi:hypothetical protein